MDNKENALQVREYFSAFLRALETTPSLRVELLRELVNRVQPLDYIQPYYDMQVAHVLIPCTEQKVKLMLRKYREYFNTPIYRLVYYKYRNRYRAFRKRLLTGEEIIHLRGIILRPLSEWGKATKLDHRAKHPEEYVSREEAKYQRATQTGRYDYKRKHYRSGNTSTTVA